MYSNILKATMLKGVDSVSLAFSKGLLQFENFMLSVSPTLRVCVRMCGRVG